jgi:hypothetical protein
MTDYPHKLTLEDYDYSVQDVAKALGYSDDWIRKSTSAGKFPAIKVNGTWRYSSKELHHIFKTEALKEQHDHDGEEK